MSSFGSTLSSNSSRGIGWSAVTTPSTSYAVPGVPLNSPAVRNGAPLGRGGGSTALDEASLTGALLMVGGFSRRGSASSTSALPVAGPSTSAYTRPLDDDDLASPSTSAPSQGMGGLQARVTRFALVETPVSSSGGVTPLSSSPGSGAASVREEGMGRRVREE